MAKKEAKESTFSTFQRVFSTVKDMLTTGIVDRVKQSTEEIADKVQDELDHIMQHFLQQLISVTLIITGLIFVSIGLVYSFRELLVFSPMVSYVLSGVIVILLASWYQHSTYMKFKLEKYQRREQK